MMAKKFEAIQLRTYDTKRLPSCYFATKRDMSIPSLRSATPATKKDSYGTFKSGRILAVRNYK